LIDERILLDIVSGQVSRAWKVAEPAIAHMRKTGGPSVCENFEYLAVRAELWMRQYPGGAYPTDLPRMDALRKRT